MSEGHKRRLPLPERVAHAGLDPLPTDTEPRPGRRWWGRHVHELRWQAELARLLVDPLYRGVGVPHGDGSPVLLIPGFLVGDESLGVLAAWLKRIGYQPRRAGIRVNVDCSDRALDRLDQRLELIHRQSGRAVSIIGHSRGGHFAKALATRRPDRVRRVISLGAGLDTPFDISLPTKAAVVAVRAAHRPASGPARRNGCLTEACDCAFARDYAAPFPVGVPLTSVYSRNDGVVWWEACIVPYAECVEVTGSHVGLAFNRRSYQVIGDRLAA